MKKLLFTLFFIIPFLSNGQNFKDLFLKADSSFNENHQNATFPVLIHHSDEVTYDTIKVKALVSYDYSYSEKYDELKIEPVFVTYLLQIRKHYYPYHPDCMIINEQKTIDIVGYLGENGEPLSRIINVWIAKKL